MRPRAEGGASMQVSSAPMCAPVLAARLNDAKRVGADRGEIVYGLAEDCRRSSRRAQGLGEGPFFI